MPRFIEVLTLILHILMLIIFAILVKYGVDVLIRILAVSSDVAI
jgi:hypothetical protein